MVRARARRARQSLEGRFRRRLSTFDVRARRRNACSRPSRRERLAAADPSTVPLRRRVSACWGDRDDRCLRTSRTASRVLARSTARLMTVCHLEGGGAARSPGFSATTSTVRFKKRHSSSMMDLSARNSAAPMSSFRRPPPPGITSRALDRERARRHFSPTSSRASAK
jgi:hypothetical protein